MSATAKPNPLQVNKLCYRDNQGDNLSGFQPDKPTLDLSWIPTIVQVLLQCWSRSEIPQRERSGSGGRSGLSAGRLPGGRFLGTQ